MAADVIEKGNGGRCPFFLHRDTFLLQVAQNPELSGGTVKAAIVLALEFYNRTLFLKGNHFGAWPTIENWASRAGLHPQTVKKAVKELSVQGHVDVRRPKTKGEGNHNFYSLVVKSPIDGSQPTTKTATIDGSQPTTNKASKGSQPTPKAVANRIHKQDDEHLDGAGARVNAPQAPEQDDGSDHIEEENQSQSDIRDLGTPERAPSPITASESKLSTEPDQGSEGKGREPWQDGPPEGLIAHWRDGSPQDEADGGEDPPQGGKLEFDLDDSQSWNSIAFPIFQECGDLFDQSHEVDIQPDIVLLAILEKLKNFDFRQTNDFGDAFAKACVSPELKAASFRHIRWWLVEQKVSRPNEVIARLRRVVDDAMRRRTKAMRVLQGSDVHEAAHG